ncbi:monooxygenase 1 [Ricinus communis]|uniref:monooxygenase 1 n=1 Tax=Ricinus communis TaxID=3988 RepID=UPI00201A311E|nr:monooxygenase 1 [Ricinus communis]XP_048232373.1 monooxygenase 1 [Ricinus communis]XP_048232374.1 monooxygenase 1 [Ricinus communis]
MEMLGQEEIVIIGGGICGLATALALHRQGVRSKVLEKSETLRTTGVGIIVRPNGWRALDQLGVAAILRQTSAPIQGGQHISVHDGKRKNLPGDGETRCLRRNDLIKALADNLPVNTVQYGCRVESIQVDPITTYPILHLHGGRVLKPKIVIGCDGVHSTTGTFLGLNSPKFSPTCVIRGFTYYQSAHEFGNEFHLVSSKCVQLGIVPVNEKLIYWFVTREWGSEDPKISRDQKRIKDSTLELLKGYPENTVHLVKNSHLDSLYLTGLTYRAPWDLLTSNFRKGTVALAGDAMHAMGPFLAQGGSVSLEDAVVIARCLAQKLNTRTMKDTRIKVLIEEGLDDYMKQRRMRVFWMCLHTYLIGSAFHSSASVKQLLSIVLLIILFRDSNKHTRYDCSQSS